MGKPKTLILGIGNTLLSDEGVGVRVVEFLEAQESALDTLTFVDGGTLSFTLAPLLEDHPQLIVVDAAMTGEHPGHVASYEGAAMDRYLKGNRRSVHEVGLMDLLDIVRLADRYPEKRALVGVEPAKLDWGEALSPPVQQSVSFAAAKVMALVGQWSTEAEV